MRSAQHRHRRIGRGAVRAQLGVRDHAAALARRDLLAEQVVAAVVLDQQRVGVQVPAP